VWGHEWPVLIAAFFVGVVSTARLVRLVVHDDFPPTEWLKTRWYARVGDSPWKKLVECHWCLPPYLVAPNLAWAVLSDLHWTWWLANGFLAATYLSSIVVAYDEYPD